MALIWNHRIDFTHAGHRRPTNRFRRFAQTEHQSLDDLRDTEPVCKTVISLQKHCMNSNEPTNSSNQLYLVYPTIINYLVYLGISNYYCCLLKLIKPTIHQPLQAWRDSLVRAVRLHGSSVQRRAASQGDVDS